MTIPKWFKRELSFVDPTYYVRINKATMVYEIVKDVDIRIPFRDRTVARVQGPRVVDVFRYLNDSALDHLRYRKWLGRRMKIVENPGRELAYLQEQEKAAMQKQKQIGYEMMSEGMMEGYRLSKKASVS